MTKLALALLFPMAMLLAGCLPTTRSETSPENMAFYDYDEQGTIAKSPWGKTSAAQTIPAEKFASDSRVNKFIAHAADSRFLGRNARYSGYFTPLIIQTAPDNRNCIGVECRDVFLEFPSPHSPNAKYRAPHVNFQLPIARHPRINEFVTKFSEAPYFEQHLERSGRFIGLFRKILAEEGLPEDLAYLPLIESGFQEHAVSPARATGLWQLMEGTSQRYGLKTNFWLDERRDPEKSTRAAAMYLRELYEEFGDWQLVLAAYNAGLGRIQRDMRSTGANNFWALSRYGTLKKETRDYVPKFFASLKIARMPERYGFRNINYSSPLKFDTVTVPSRTDLSVIAHLCDVSYEEIKALNPELRRGCTPPGVRNYRVHIPRGKARIFTARYAQLPIEERVIHMAPKTKARAIAAASHPQPAKKMVTSTYTVRQGDTLSQIAQRFNVGKNELQHWNSLHTKRALRTGQRLNIAQMVSVMPHNGQEKSVAASPQGKSASTAGKAVTGTKKSSLASSTAVVKTTAIKTDNKKNTPVTTAVTNKKAPIGKEKTLAANQKENPKAQADKKAVAVLKNDSKKNIPVTTAVTDQKASMGKGKTLAANQKENPKAQAGKKAVTALPDTKKSTAASNAKTVTAPKKKIVVASGSKIGRTGKRS